MQALETTRARQTVLSDHVAERGKVYTSEQVMRSYGIAPSTLKKWKEKGLKSSPIESRRDYFLGDDLIAFMFPHADSKSGGGQ